jgi:hypothetical protein
MSIVSNGFYNYCDKLFYGRETLDKTLYKNMVPDYSNYSVKADFYNGKPVVFCWGKPIVMAFQDVTVTTLIPVVAAVDSVFRSVGRLIRGIFSMNYQSVGGSLICAEMAIVHAGDVLPACAFYIPKLAYQILHIFGSEASTYPYKTASLGYMAPSSRIVGDASEQVTEDVYGIIEDLSQKLGKALKYDPISSRVFAVFVVPADIVLDGIAHPIIGLLHIVRAVIELVGCCIFAEGSSIRNVLGHAQAGLERIPRFCAAGMVAPFKIVHNLLATWWDPADPKTIDLVPTSFNIYEGLEKAHWEMLRPMLRPKRR